MEKEKPEKEYKFINCWERQENYIGENWPEHYVVFGHNRDSGPLDESNWDTMIKLLDDNSFEYRVEYFNHWAVGWVECILVHESQTEALDFTEEINRKISEDYPVLDEMDFSDKETELINESWSDWIEWDFIQAVESKFNVEIDSDIDIKPLFNLVADNINEYPIIESNSVYVNVEKVVDSIDIKDLYIYLTEDSLYILLSEEKERLDNQKPNNDSGKNKTLDNY